MIKILISLFLLISFLDASIKDINSKIDTNKKQFKLMSSKKSNINKNLASIGAKINKEEKEYLNIVSILEKTNTELLLNKIKLSSTISRVKKLKNKSKTLHKNKIKIEKNAIDFVIEKYALSMGIEQAHKEKIKDVIDKEVYKLIFDDVKDEILNLNIDYLKVNNTIRNNEKKINKYTIFINKQNAIKNKFKNLEVIQAKTLEKLKKRHKSYQGYLKKLIDKQNNITNLLGDLNILKKKEIKAEERRIKKAKAIAKKKEIARKKRVLKEKKERERLLKKELSKKEPIKTKSIKFTKRKKLDKAINVEVKKIGSSIEGIKISNYKGKKTIAPLKSYTITKKFGKYYDKVYKMELFNEAASLKTKKPNAKVFCVFKGQIVYAKQNSALLANVVIVKHKNNLHTIYSHLDKISPTLKVGKWIPKGYVVGRVNDTLEFQATKNSKYIDPMKLVK